MENDALQRRFPKFVAGAGIEPASGGSFTLPVSRKNGLSHNPVKDSPIIVSEPFPIANYRDLAADYRIFLFFERSRSSFRITL